MLSCFVRVLKMITPAEEFADEASAANPAMSYITLRTMIDKSMHSLVPWRQSTSLMWKRYLANITPAVMSQRCRCCWT